MKLSHLFTGILLSSLIFVMGCKKGEKDPKFTLLTRKARVIGDWRMTSGTAGYTFVKNSVSYYFLLDGGGYTANETPIGQTAYIYKGVYTLSMSFRKDGSFTFEENVDGKTINGTGTWNFTGAVGKDKNKESIVIELSGATGDATYAHLFNKFSTEFTYKIVELKNKEMILTSGSAIDIDASGRSSFQGEFTLKQ